MTFSSLFTGSSSLSVFARGVLYVCVGISSFQRPPNDGPMMGPVGIIRPFIETKLQVSALNGGTPRLFVGWWSSFSQEREKSIFLTK